MSEAFNARAIDTELQVRLMNLVLGEASDFERDQLQLLMEQRTELVAYYQHLQHLHGLLSEVGAGEPSLEADASTAGEPWRLPAERREHLLAVLDGKALPASVKVTLPELTTVYSVMHRLQQRSSRWVVATLSVAAAAAILAALSLQSVQSAKLANEVLDRTRSRPDIAAALGYAASQADSALIDNSKSMDGFPASLELEGRKKAAANGVWADHGAELFREKSAKEQNGRSEKYGYLMDGEKPRQVPADSSISGVANGTSVDKWFGDAARTEDIRDYRKSGVASAASEPSKVAFSEGQSGQSAFPVPDSETAFLSGIKRFADGRAALSDKKSLHKNTSGDQETSQTLAVSPRIITEAEVEEIISRSRTEGEQEAAVDKAAVDKAAVDKAATSQLDSQSDRLAAEERQGNSSDADMLGEPPNELAKNRWGLPAIKAYDLMAILEESNQKKLTAEARQTQDGWERNEPGKDNAQSGERNAESLHWRFIPAFSPEIAASPRPPIALERKAAEPKLAEAVEQVVSMDEQNAAADAFSTFSLHVSDVSFKLAQAALGQGQWPEAAKIRIEEFVNALDYHDPLPAGDLKVACRIEQAIHPFLMQRNLLRVSMRTAAAGRSQQTPLRLTLVLDNSGSMERVDRRQAVLRAVQTLTTQLRADDQVTLISFANTPRLLADKVPGQQAESLLKLIENLPSEGGTNLEAALTLAREKAIEQKLADAQNRIVLLTDGAVNLGDASPDSLAKLVTQLRDSGIAFDAAGISAADVNDEVLEALTRQGDGRYYVLDSAEAVGESFAAQIAGALRPSAQNVKVQVEFNPLRVGRFKLLGFEKHRLEKEDFRNDKVDAAEMAAAEAGVALYQLEVKPSGSGDVGSVSVRFRDLATGQMVERRWPIPYDSSVPRLEQAEPTLQLAAAAALFAAKLSGGPLGDSVDLADLQKLLANLSEQYAFQPRVVQLRTMLDQAKAISP